MFVIKVSTDVLDALMETPARLVVRLSAASEGVKRRGDAMPRKETNTKWWQGVATSSLTADNKNTKAFAIL